MKVKKPNLKKILENGKFRKDVVDVVMILPKTEGNIQGGALVTMRVPLISVTNVDFMTGVFRQMWVTLAKDDKQLNAIFEEMFKNQAIERKRLERMVARETKKALKNGKIKPTAEELKIAEEKLKAMFNEN